MKELDEDCFCREHFCYRFVSIIIPTTIKFISHSLLMKLPDLKELTVPSTFELHGNRLFFVKDNCLHSIELPESVKKVNGREVQL